MDQLRSHCTESWQGDSSAATDLRHRIEAEQCVADTDSCAALSSDPTQHRSRGAYLRDRWSHATGCALRQHRRELCRALGGPALLGWAVEGQLRWRRWQQAEGREGSHGPRTLRQWRARNVAVGGQLTWL